jgi:hypothetical protein
MLFSAFTGSRPATLFTDNDSSYKDSKENLTDDLSNSILAYNSDGETLINNKPNSRITKLGIICYGDIDFFLLRNPNNPKRDILITEIDFRNLKDRSKDVNG